MAIARKSGFRIRNAGAVLILAGLLILPPSIARAHGNDCRGGDDDDKDIAALAAQVAALQSQVNALSGLSAQIASLQSQINALSTLATQVAGLQTTVNTLQTSVNGFQQQISGLTNLASLGTYISINPGTVNGVLGPNLVFSGVNVQIVNGSTSTTTPNGLGNLIIGYNDDSGPYQSTTDANRSGSHNLIVGDEHRYTSAGGIVAGYGNQISSLYASVTGGTQNAALAYASTVSGGDSNSAKGSQSSISGGHFNVAAGTQASVSGGESNGADGEYAAVGGGTGNDATTQWEFLPAP
ncbi:MAG TPA: hypothetical protein VEF03_06875 [Candidatus Binataceae bacterium]|nr:hypothetical protein [Candidatus Binataceae bacterium]